MNIKSIIENIILLSVATLITFSVAVSSESSKKEYASFSDDLAKTMTLIATRPIDSVDGTFFINGLVDGDGMDFFKSVMGYSDQKIADNRQKAIEFYKNRFGLDINDPRLYFTGYQVNPASDYRALIMNGNNNSDTISHPVLDGGWGLFVMSPEGIELGGDFAGTHVPAGSMFAYGGSYVIKQGQDRDDIVIHYQARGPLQPKGTGSIFDLEIFHPKLGSGISWGYSELHSLSDNNTSGQTRSVLSFAGFAYKEQNFQY